MKKDILVICGPSGVGKGTLISYLMREFPNKFGFSISHTSRKPRGTEVEGLDYYFCTNDEFEHLLSENVFVEHAKVHEHYYGTSKQAIEDIVSTGKYCLIDIDIQGLEQMQNSSFKDRAYYIGILPKSLEDLRDRLVKRNTDSDESIQIRLSNSIKEIERIKSNSNIRLITNDNLQETLAEFFALIRSYWNDIIE